VQRPSDRNVWDIQSATETACEGLKRLNEVRGMRYRRLRGDTGLCILSRVLCIGAPVRYGAHDFSPYPKSISRSVPTDYLAS
jgi:hypothetical protein